MAAQPSHYLVVGLVLLPGIQGCKPLVRCGGECSHTTRGTEHQWGEGAVFHLSNWIFIAPLPLLLVSTVDRARQVSVRQCIGIEYPDIKKWHICVGHPRSPVPECPERLLSERKLLRSLALVRSNSRESERTSCPCHHDYCSHTTLHRSSPLTKTSILDYYIRAHCPPDEQFVMSCRTLLRTEF